MLFDYLYAFNTLDILLNSLNNNELTTKLNYDCINDKYIMGIKKQTENIYFIRFWKSPVIFNYAITSMNSNNLFGCVDFIINDNSIKIDYLYISDTYDYEKNKDNIYMSKKDTILNDNDSYEFNKSILKYLEYIAKDNNTNNIIIDVHNNLKYYEKYYKNEGFLLTNKRCNDNPFWIETVKII